MHLCTDIVHGYTTFKAKKGFHLLDFGETRKSLVSKTELYTVIHHILDVKKICILKQQQEILEKHPKLPEQNTKGLHTNCTCS